MATPVVRVLLKGRIPEWLSVYAVFMVTSVRHDPWGVRDPDDSEQGTPSSSRSH